MKTFKMQKNKIRHIFILEYNARLPELNLKQKFRNLCYVGQVLEKKFGNEKLAEHILV